MQGNVRQGTLLESKHCFQSTVLIIAIAKPTSFLKEHLGAVAQQNEKQLLSQTNEAKQDMAKKTKQCTARRARQERHSTGKPIVESRTHC